MARQKNGVKKKGSKPGGDGPASPPSGTWRGLDDDPLRELVQHLCRIRNRRLLFGGNLDPVLEHGPAGMCGRLVNEALTFLRERRVDNLPSQQDLARLVQANPGSFGQFLDGIPSRNPPWVATAQTCVRYLAGGPNPGPRPLLDRLDDYFFRDFDTRIREAIPPFFRAERARFGEPCSRTELAGEIEWYAVERESTGRAAKLVWVSGERAFLADGATGTVGRAIRRAVDAGVQMRFVHHSPSSPAANSLDELFRGNGLSPTPVMSRVDTASSAGLPERWWEFVNPALQFLYLKIETDKPNRPDEILYIVRSPEEDRRERYGPVALEAHNLELAAFRAWLDRMERANLL